jgi:uncharacterized repeat protein (TIGR03809 family)
MPAEPAVQTYDAMARKWCELAQKRRAHLVALYDSGHWQRYYDEVEFRQQLQQAMAAVEIWKRVAGDQHAPP